MNASTVIGERKIKKTPNTKEEKVMLVTISALLVGLSTKLRGKKCIQLIANVFGVRVKTIRDIIFSFVERNGDTSRQERSDKGTNFFNAGKKVKSTFTALNGIMRKMRREIRESPNPLTNDELKIEYANLTINQKESYHTQADTFISGGPFLHQDLIKILKAVKGSASWDRLEDLLGKIVTRKTIRNYCMSLPTFKYKVNRIFPHLDEAAKKRRMIWVRIFWIFWKSAKCLKDTSVLLTQMDEKCSFAIVTRGSNKSISSLGIEPIAQTSHHKSYIHKVMGIVVTGFIPLDNDIEKGGRAIKISLE